MDALDRLNVKLAATRHVRNVGYWHLPYGTVIVSRPKTVDLNAAPEGAKVNTGSAVFSKTGPKEWSSGKAKVSTEDLAHTLQINETHGYKTKLALPPSATPAKAAPSAPQKAVFKGPARSAPAPAKAAPSAPQKDAVFKGPSKSEPKAPPGAQGKHLFGGVKRPKPTPAQVEESKKISEERSRTAQKEGTAAAHADAAASHRKAAAIHRAAGDGAGAKHHSLAAETHRASADKITAAEEQAKVDAAHKVLTAQAKFSGELDDQQYAARQQALETALKAHRAAATEHQFRRYGVWAPERAKQHKEIVEKLLGEQTKTAKKDKKMLIAGGLGGAGKSTTLGKIGIDPKDYVTINPDDVKEEMAKRGMVPEIEGLSPMEAASLIHEESGDIANAMLRAAEVDGYNVIQDITMSSIQTVDRRLREAHDYGYGGGVHSIFVDIPVETSVQRALSRHRRGMEDHRAGKGNGGRYVPPSIIRKSSDAEFGSVNRHAFESMREHFAGWQLWDNSGSGPQHMATGGNWHL